MNGLTYILKRVINYIHSLIGTENMGTEAVTIKGAIAEHSDKIGNTTMGTTATTITGAIAELNNNKANKGIIARLGSGIDLNNYTGDEKSGLYQVQTGVSNAPQDWCWLLVIGGSGTTQVVFTQNKIYLRSYTGSPLAWTSWVTVASTTVETKVVYDKYCHAIKRNGIVTVTGMSSNNIQVSNSYLALTTLPAGYRPTETIYFAGNAQGGTAQILGYVNTSGIVYLYSNVATKYWAYSVTYPVSD